MAAQKNARLSLLMMRIINLPTIKPKANIGILGGSFDPPHLGHTSLALCFLSLEPIDELWVIPCAHHALKHHSNDFHHRLAMCKLAFSRINNVKVLDLEQHLPSPNYTIRTIDVINNVYPDINIFLGLGSDLLADFHQWHQAKDLTKKTEIVIFERPRFPITHIPAELAYARIHKNNWLLDIASSSIRTHDEELDEFKSLIDHIVLDYITQHKLYRHS